MSNAVAAARRRQAPPPRATPARAHAGTLRQFKRFSASIGLDLNACLDPELKSWVDRVGDVEFVPATVVVDVLQIAAAVTQRDDLGTSFAAWSNIRGFGPLSLMWDHCSTFAEVIRIADKFLRLENEALGTSVEIEGDEVALNHFAVVPARLGASVFLEATLALDVKLARAMFGSGWKPLRVELTQARSRHSRFRAAFFGAPLEYGAQRNALVISRADLHRVQPNANPSMLKYLEQHVTSLSGPPLGDFVKHVEQVITAQLSGGGANVEHVSSLMALSRRTFQRRLAEHGATFADLLQSVRQRVAAAYFTDELSPNLTDLSYRLGFRDAGVAGRFLRRHVAPTRTLKRRHTRTPRPM